MNRYEKLNGVLIEAQTYINLLTPELQELEEGKVNKVIRDTRYLEDAVYTIILTMLKRARYCLVYSRREIEITL